MLESVVSEVTRCMQSVGHRCWASLLGITSKEEPLNWMPVKRNYSTAYIYPQFTRAIYETAQTDYQYETSERYTSRLLTV